MPSIQIKDVPEDVHAVLRRRAAASGQSLQEYLRSRLVQEARQVLLPVPACAMPSLPHPPLLDRIWAPRDNVPVYDASYIALAEALDRVLLTAVVRLARAAGLRCEVEVMALPSGTGP